LMSPGLELDCRRRRVWRGFPGYPGIVRTGDFPMPEDLGGYEPGRRAVVKSGRFVPGKSLARGKRRLQYLAGHLDIRRCKTCGKLIVCCPVAANRSWDQTQLARVMQGN